MERKLALSYIKSRKKKNLIAIITITLVTAFLTAVCLYGYSYNKMIVNSIFSVEGKYHGNIGPVDEGKLEKIESHASVKSIGEVSPVTYEMNESENIFYDYYDENALGYYSLEVINCIYPTEENEVAIDRLYADKFNKKIDDEIRFLDRKFKVVGIVDSVEYTREDEKIYSVYVSKELAKSLNTESLALVELNEVVDHELELENLAKLISLNKENVNLNQSMISASNNEIAEVGMFVLIGLLVIASAFFIIYNIFYISLGERMKSLGLLLTIGFTGKQVRKMVLYEAFILSILAIPLGLIIGILSTKILVDAVYVNGDLRFIMNPFLIVGVLFLTLLTVGISVILPAYKVSKLSPIEASKFVQVVKIPKKRKKVKESKNFFKNLAKLNLMRNRRTNLITSISMTLSITLFIVSAGIIKSMSIKNMTQYKFVSNVQVNLNFRDFYEKNYIPYKIIDELEEKVGEGNVEGLKITSTADDENRDKVVGINDEIVERAKKKIVEGIVDSKAFKDGKSAIVPQVHGSSKYSIGDIIKVKKDNGEIDELKVTAIVKEPLVEINGGVVYTYNGSEIFSDNNEFAKLLVTSKQNESREIGEKIKPVIDKYKNLEAPENFLDSYEALKDEKQGIALVGYTVVGVIALIGIMNFINSTISGIMARRKELGMLRAVGITDNEIKGMLIKEGVYKIIPSVIIGVILGNIITYISVFFASNYMGAYFMVYTMPIVETIACILIVLLVLILVTKAVTKRILSDSVIEQIRFED